MRFKRMQDLDLRNQRVFIRADLNVPLDDAGGVADDTRIRASVPGIRLALEKGAAVMVTSHLGRPKEGELRPEDSLAPVAKRLGELLGREVPLKHDWVGGVEVRPGEVVLLENCRVNKGEKKDDEALARKRFVVLLLALVDAAVLEQHHLAGPHLDAAHPVVLERHLAPEQLAQALRHRRERILGPELAFLRAAEMGGHHDRGPLLEREADARDGGANARVVGDAAGVVQRHVEVCADEDPLVPQVEVLHALEAHGPTSRPSSRPPHRACGWKSPTRCRTTSPPSRGCRR